MHLQSVCWSKASPSSQGNVFVPVHACQLKGCSPDLQLTVQITKPRTALLVCQPATLVLQVPHLTLAKLEALSASAQPTSAAGEATAPVKTGSKEEASEEESEPDQAMKIIPVVPRVMPPALVAPSPTSSRSSSSPSEPVMHFMQVSFGLHGASGHATAISCPSAHQNGSLLLLHESACLHFIVVVSSLFPISFLRRRCRPS